VVRLDIPVPPMLLDLLGIPDTPQILLGFFWDRGGELRFSDGRILARCCTDAFCVYASHPAVQPSLAPYHLDPDQRGTDFWLVLYRVGWFDAVRAAEAEPYLRHAHPPWIPFQVINRLPPDPPPEQLERMTAWLDAILAWRF
jgi:hypothetical protein